MSIFKNSVLAFPYHLMNDIKIDNWIIKTIVAYGVNIH